VQGQHAGTAGNVGHGEIRTVHQVGPRRLHLAIEAPDPPAALRGIARSASPLEIGGSALRHAERLVGEQKEFVVGKAARQRQAELAGITRQAAAREPSDAASIATRME
jgi:hypothetical protein